MHMAADTTMYEKAIAYPTDSRLRACRCSTHEARGARNTELRSLLGRVMRDVPGKASQPSTPLCHGLKIPLRIFSQQRHDSPKLYSVHEPEVECKVAAGGTTNDYWIVSIQAVHGNRYNGKTLKPTQVQVRQVTGIKPEQAVVDQRFRGCIYHLPGVKALIVGLRKGIEVLTTLFLRRDAIEPIIDHTRNYHPLLRNHLPGKTGDKINMLLSACGPNLAKLIRFFTNAQPTWRCA